MGRRMDQNIIRRTYQEERDRLAHMNWSQKTWENLMPIIDTVEEIYSTVENPTLHLNSINCLILY